MILGTTHFLPLIITYDESFNIYLSIFTKPKIMYGNNIKTLFFKLT